MYADTHMARTHTYDAPVLIEVSLDETKQRKAKVKIVDADGQIELDHSLTKVIASHVQVDSAEADQ